ncbi:hypothetical protein MCOR02_007842 [Pyricularia oryzae]|nr:hypothetical protein MCOR02_007842 [Pyricularia oryzae]
MVAADGGSFRTIGICFQNMNVFGFGAATDFQKTVSNVWLEAANMLRTAYIPQNNAGETNGLNVDQSAYFNYQGLSAEEMHKRHRGEAIYTAEVELPAGALQGLQDALRKPYRDVVMAIFGISHTINTRVGNEYIRGVSGGERNV